MQNDVPILISLFFFLFFTLSLSNKASSKMHLNVEQHIYIFPSLTLLNKHYWDNRPEIHLKYVTKKNRIYSVQIYINTINSKYELQRNQSPWWSSKDWKYSFAQQRQCCFQRTKSAYCSLKQSKSSWLLALSTKLVAFKNTLLFDLENTTFQNQFFYSVLFHSIYFLFIYAWLLYTSLRLIFMSCCQLILFIITKCKEIISAQKYSIVIICRAIFRFLNHLSTWKHMQYKISKIFSSYQNLVARNVLSVKQQR